MILHTKKPKGIIFDCDGVIINSYNSNTEFYNRLRASVDLPPMTEEQRILVHQLTGIQAIDLVIPKALQKDAMKSYNDIDYVRDIVPKLTIYEGLHEFLAYCKSINLPCAIHTNRIIAMEEILVTFGLKEYYQYVITPADMAAKPDPIGSLTICERWNIEPVEALFIGDSDNDRKTAKAANIPFIGFGNEELDTESKAKSFSEIDKWVKTFDL